MLHNFFHLEHHTRFNKSTQDQAPNVGGLGIHKIHRFHQNAESSVLHCDTFCSILEFTIMTFYYHRASVMVQHVSCHLTIVSGAGIVLFGKWVWGFNGGSNIQLVACTRCPDTEFPHLLLKLLLQVANVTISPNIYSSTHLLLKYILSFRRSNQTEKFLA